MNLGINWIYIIQHIRYKLNFLGKKVYFYFHARWLSLSDEHFFSQVNSRVKKILLTRIQFGHRILCLTLLLHCPLLLLLIWFLIRKNWAHEGGLPILHYICVFVARIVSVGKLLPQGWKSHCWKWQAHSVLQ